MPRSNCKFVRENWMHEFGQPHWPVKSTPTQLLNRTHDLGEPLVCDIEAAFTPAFFLHPPHCLCPQSVPPLQRPGGRGGREPPGMPISQNSPPILAKGSLRGGSMSELIVDR